MAVATHPLPGSSDPAAPQMVDWDLAVSSATRLMRSGPEVARDEAALVVSQLRRFAAEAEVHVRRYTLLEAESATAPVVVVDRPRWVQANVDGLRQVIDPLVARLRSSRGEPGALATGIGSRITGLEAGGLFAFLSGKVLGQFDPFYTGPTDTGPTSTGPSEPVAGAGSTSYGGRMLLVAPNIVQVERELGVEPTDFRLWVCLHEETHRVQFTAVPWLRTHLLGELETLLDRTDLDPGRLAQLARDAAERIGSLIRGDGQVSLLDIVSTPEQREVVERLTAVMSLLEGHADVVMDGVGPEVVESVGDIRQLFDKRRGGAGPIDQMIRRLLGLDAKLRQYRDGAGFVRGVLDKVGMAGFNAVWAEPANLPSKAEISDPALWVTRIHG